MHEDELIETIDLRRARHLAAPLRRVIGAPMVEDLALGRSMVRALARGEWQTVRVVPRQESSGAPVTVVDLFGTPGEKRSLV